MIDRKKVKRFKLLCLKDSDFRKHYSWWRFAIVGNAPYIENPLPKFKGERIAVVAYRQHVANLIQHYAPRVKLPCGHSGRTAHCIKCAEVAVSEFETFKASWLTRKGITEEQWRARVDKYNADDPVRAKELAPSEYILSLLRGTEEKCAVK